MFKMKFKLWLPMLLAAILAACSQQSPLSEAPATAESEIANQSVETAEKLGTSWGDEVQSSVHSVDLRRVTKNPLAEGVLNYSVKDYRGKKINSISLAAGKVELSVQSDNGDLFPIFRDGSNYFLQGKDGQSYRLVYKNNSNKTLEIVASVDGLDVVSGQAASRYSDGYVLYPHDSLVIEGFRKSDDAVASFVFSNPEDSYAANSDKGSIKNTGVIGTAIFELYDPTQKNSESDAFPADNGYAQPPSK